MGRIASTTSRLIPSDGRSGESIRCGFCGRELRLVYRIERGGRVNEIFEHCSCDEARRRGFAPFPSGEGRKLYPLPGTEPRRGVPERFRDAECDPEYVRRVEGGRWLYIHGEVGVGKTYLASAILNALAPGSPASSRPRWTWTGSIRWSR